MNATDPNSLNNYIFPAEWQARRCTWLTWPHNKDTWPHHFAKAEIQYAAMVAAISMDEPCQILAHSKLSKDRILKLLSDFSYRKEHIQFVDIDTNDSWIRDYGPIFLNSKENLSGNSDGQVILNFGYNAWGGKYPPFDKDQSVCAEIARSLEVPLIDSKIILEGGAIESNGAGIVMTTRFCTMNQNRNPNWKENELEETLSRQLGGAKIWLLPGNPIEGDDTDGHIDQIARFTPCGNVLISINEDQGSNDYQSCQENLLTLKEYCQPVNYKIKALPTPQPISFDGQSIPASYTNYYITKNRVLVPQFEDPADGQAVEIIQSCFPNHQTVPLGSKYLSDGLGSFHCLTQQQPMP